MALRCWRRSVPRVAEAAAVSDRTEPRVLMRIFLGPSYGARLSTTLVTLLRSHGIAGATVLRGVAGFGRSSVLHEARLLRLAADVPIVVEVVETRAQIEAVLPEIDHLMTGGLITIEEVRVLRRRAGRRPA
jgi:uncharacterized protein